MHDCCDTYACGCGAHTHTYTHILQGIKAVWPCGCVAPAPWRGTHVALIHGTHSGVAHMYTHTHTHTHTHTLQSVKALSTFATLASDPSVAASLSQEQKDALAAQQTAALDALNNMAGSVSAVCVREVVCMCVCAQVCVCVWVWVGV